MSAGNKGKDKGKGKAVQADIPVGASKAWGASELVEGVEHSTAASVYLKDMIVIVGVRAQDFLSKWLKTVSEAYKGNLDLKVFEYLRQYQKRYSKILYDLKAVRHQITVLEETQARNYNTLKSITTAQLGVYTIAKDLIDDKVRKSVAVRLQTEPWDKRKRQNIQTAEEVEKTASWLVNGRVDILAWLAVKKARLDEALKVQPGKGRLAKQLD